MSKEIFKTVRGHLVFKENIYEALQELAYEWCSIKGIYDKYPTVNAWRKACMRNDIPNIEVVHEFLTMFLPKELQESNNLDTKKLHEAIQNAIYKKGVKNEK